MSQAEWIVFFFKIALVADLAAIFAFVVVYTVLASWWRNIIGRSIVFLDALLGLAIVPAVASMFWHFNRLTSYIAAWMDVGIFGLIAIVMTWRCVTWVRIHRKSNSENAVEPEEQS